MLNNCFGLSARFQKLSLSILLLLIFGCATGPTRFSDYEEGQWKGKALLKANGRNLILNLEINALKNKKLRIDVWSALSTHEASLILDEKEVTYVLLRDKKYFKGPATSASLKDLIKVPLKPSHLFNLLFDEEIVEKTWSCEKDKDAFLSSCSNARNKLNIKWVKRAQRQRIIDIKHRRNKVQLYFKSFNSEIAKRPKLFDIKIPKNFRRIRR